MLIKEHWGIENAPCWRCFMLYITRSDCKIFVIETHENKEFNYIQYIMPDTNKNFKFDLRTESFILVENWNQISWHGYQTAK